MSDLSKDFILKCTMIDVNQRIAPEQIELHPLIQNSMQQEYQEMLSQKSQQQPVPAPLLQQQQAQPQSQTHTATNYSKSTQAMVQPDLMMVPSQQQPIASHLSQPGQTSHPASNFHSHMEEESAYQKTMNQLMKSYPKISENNGNVVGSNFANEVQSKAPSQLSEMGVQQPNPLQTVGAYKF